MITGVTIAELRTFGLAGEVASVVLTITDEEQFDALCDALPELHGVALLDLRAGKSYQVVYDDLFGLEGLGEIDTEDFDAARPGSRQCQTSPGGRGRRPGRPRAGSVGDPEPPHHACG